MVVCILALVKYGIKYGVVIGFNFLTHSVTYLQTKLHRPHGNRVTTETHSQGNTCVTK